MKFKIFAAVALGAVVVSSVPVSAQQMNADDLKWINQCIRDNKREGATPEVVRKYCICMNEKMDDSEKKSITQWEKENPKEREACDKEAGWK